MMLEGESLVQEFKYWEIRILQICVQATPLEVDSRRIKFELKRTPRYLAVCSRDNASPLMRGSRSWGEEFL